MEMRNIFKTVHCVDCKWCQPNKRFIAETDQLKFSTCLKTQRTDEISGVIDNVPCCVVRILPFCLKFKKGEKK